MPSQPPDSLPAPVGGWNTYDALAAMPTSDAVTLDNFFPETSYVRLRRGYAQFCATGATGAVKTLAEHTGGATSKFLAAADGKIFEISSGTATSLATGFGSDVWSYTAYESAAGQFTVLANASGADIPQIYNGTTLAAVAVTGVTATTLSMCLNHASRMFYVQRNTLSVWYTTAGAYQGALTQFDFGPLCQRGGAIAGIGTWTRDNGFGGGDDLFCIITTMGECLIYSGTDPSSASAWALKGRFLLGRPVSGPNCLVRTGPDLILIGEDGYQPLSSYLTIGSTQALQSNLAKKISNAAASAVASYKANAGWQGFIYPQGAALIINVPTTPTTSIQHVVNLATGAWCRFTRLNANCWSLYQSRPYFGGAAGKVYKYDTALSDNGADIVGELVTAFAPIGGAGGLKRYTMARPVVQAAGVLTYSLGIETDYVISSVLPTVSSNTTTAGTWDSAKWDAAVWDTAPALQRRWVTVSGLGYVAAAHMKVSTHTQTVQVNSFDILSERGMYL